MSFTNDFTISSIQYVAVKFKRNRLDHSEQCCLLRIGFCQKHIVILLVLIVRKHAQPTRTVDFRVFLNGITECPFASLLKGTNYSIHVSCFPLLKRSFL